MNDDGNNPSPDGFSAVPPGDPPRAHFDTPWSEPIPLADVLAPTWASLRVERGAPADGDRRRPGPEIDIIRHTLTRHSVLLTRLAREFAASRSGTQAPAPPERSKTSHAAALPANTVNRPRWRVRSASVGCPIVTVTVTTAPLLSPPTSLGARDSRSSPVSAHFTFAPCGSHTAAAPSPVGDLLRWAFRRRPATFTKPRRPEGSNVLTHATSLRFCVQSTKCEQQLIAAVPCSVRPARSAVTCLRGPAARQTIRPLEHFLPQFGGVKNMPRSPAQPPTQQDALALHQRLLAQDPTAANDLADAYLELLVIWLGEIAPKVSEDIRLEAAEDAILALIRKPESYSPELQTLEVYLRMSARGDMLNLLSKERRHKKREVPYSSVELLPDAGKYLGRNDDPALPLSLAEEKQSGLSTIPGSVRRKMSETDLRALGLMLQKERRNAVFAELYGLLHLPTEEQERMVKRHKDRLKKVLKRAGGKP
jgi:RNA polymerase sigma-70 factor (ECF subfamily)